MINHNNGVSDRLVSESFGFRDFWRIYRSFSNKGKSLVQPLFNDHDVLTSAANKAELFAKQFSYNSTLDDTGHVLLQIQLKTDVNLSSIHITPKLVVDVLSSFSTLLKLQAPMKSLQVALQNCSPDLFFIICRLFRKCIEESCYLSVGNRHMLSLYSKTLVRDLTFETIVLLALSLIISNVIESLIKSSLTRHLESLHFFSDHQYGFILADPLLML